MHGDRFPIHGRGTAEDPPNRFEILRYIPDPDQDPEDSLPKTHFLKDPSRSVITTNNSPDVGFDVSINPYRGCEHGCIYCYARPTHEYLGFSAGLDFETKILVKENAPNLLRRELSSPRWQDLRRLPRAWLSFVLDLQPLFRSSQRGTACFIMLNEALAASLLLSL